MKSNSITKKVSSEVLLITKYSYNRCLNINMQVMPAKSKRGS